MVQINTVPVTSIDPVQKMLAAAFGSSILEEFLKELFPVHSCKKIRWLNIFKFCYGLNCYYIQEFDAIALPEFRKIDAKRHKAGRSNAANL
jgi:hypothetical protein